MEPLTRSARDGRPLAVRVYERIRDLIVDGRISADAQLVQEQVAESLGVSRTPVRDALTRLAQEGLVTWVPGSGYLVNELTEQDINEVYQVRQNLELMATRLACGNHDRTQQSRLRTLIEEMAATDPSDTTRHFDLNRQFHQAVIAPCGNRLLMQMIDNLWDHPVNRRITRSYLHDSHNVARMVDEHWQILEAVQDANEDRLTTLISEHMFEGYQEATSGSTPPQLS